MSSERNWCEFFANIEKDPKAIVPRITVREYLQATEHIQNCDVCFNSTERTLSKAPPENKIGFQGSEN